MFWGFFFLGGFAVFVLRFTDREASRPFAVPLYPLTPLVFCASSLYLMYSSWEYARWLTLIGVVPLAIGTLLAGFARRRDGE